MSITEEEYRRYGIEFLYHITHVRNMPSILEHGLLSHNDVHQFRISYIDISDPKVQRRRTKKTPRGCAIHDYVSLYFNARNAMLYRIQNNMQYQDISILRMDRQLLEVDGAVFTDENAASTSSVFFDCPRNLNKLYWECIHARHPWKMYPRGKSIRCAEVLVPGPIPIDRVQYIVVKDLEAKSRISNTLIDHGGIRERVVVDPKLFFD